VCSYENCKTPNPCIECNRYLKFGVFYQKALELQCDYVATGHYAKIEYAEEYQQYVMKKSEADKKDQTYFLYSIPKEVLPKIIYPLENFKDKEEVRKLAEKYGYKGEFVSKGGNYSKVTNALASGKSLVIVLMGPGTFTSGGHYIVLTGTRSDGHVSVADPASRARTQTKWYAFSLIVSQMRPSGFLIITK